MRDNGINEKTIIFIKIWIDKLSRVRNFKLQGGTMKELRQECKEITRIIEEQIDTVEPQLLDDIIESYESCYNYKLISLLPPL